MHDIRLSLMAPAGARLSDIDTVLSFPNALSQCRGFLCAALPQARPEPARSTAEEP
jgi:prephenate dehydratase